MRQLLLLFFAVVFFSCKNGFHSPDDKQIQKTVINMYEKRNEADGAGGWTIKQAEVLKSWSGKDKRHFNARVSVRGVHTAAPLAVRGQDEIINETIDVALIWTGEQWITDNK